MHLQGNINFSTFRITLACLLQKELALSLERPGRIDATSEEQLTRWMYAHLRVVYVPYPDRATLGVVEHMVLQALDPPLNLRGMPLIQPRIRLAALRAQVSRGIWD